MKNLSNNEAGFTLIEILVVMLIISIVSSAALFSLSVNQNHRLESFAKQLTRTFLLAEQQAMLQPAVLGFVQTKHAYAFYRYSEKNHTWSMLNDTALGSHDLSSDAKLSLSVQNKNVPIADTAEKITPQLIISTSGDITPFVIYLGKPNKPPRYRIVGEANGSIHHEPIPTK